MQPINKITYSILYLMLFSPLISYLTVHSLGLVSSTYFFRALVIPYGIFFLLYKKNIKIGKPLYFLIFYILYLFVWSFVNGELKRLGLLRYIGYDYQIPMLFILIIIDNTEFSERFIRRSLFIFKVTVFIAVIASIIQVYDKSFLDASKYYGHKEMLRLNKYEFRRVSIFGFVNELELGLSFIPFLGVLIGYLLYNKKNSIFFLILGGIIAALSNTRFIIIGFVIITFQVFVANKANISGFFKYILIILLCLFTLDQVLNFLGYNYQSWFEKRLFAEGHLMKTTRYGAIINFAIFFPQKPIFGTGVFLTKEIMLASKAIGSSMIHVGYLSHLVSYGIVGSFFLFGFWFLLAKKLYETAKLTNYWGSLFAFLIYLWSQLTFAHYSIFFYGLIFALVFDKYFQDNFQINLTSKNR